MQKFLEELFYVPKHSKVTDNLISKRLVSSVAVVLLCLAAISFSAYAYFSSGVSSGTINIKSASFTTDVSIEITNTQNGSIDVITSNHKSHIAILDANTKYKVVLKRNANCTAKTGFMVVTIEGYEYKYHTQQLGEDGDSFTELIEFYIATDSRVKVQFFAHWGTSSLYGSDESEKRYITQNETLDINTSNKTNESQSTKNNSSNVESQDNANSSASSTFIDSSKEEPSVVTGSENNSASEANTVSNQNVENSNQATSNQTSIDLLTSDIPSSASIDNE